MSDAAREVLRQHCSREVVEQKLRTFFRAHELMQHPFDEQPGVDSKAVSWWRRR